MKKTTTLMMVAALLGIVTSDMLLASDNQIDNCLEPKSNEMHAEDVENDEVSVDKVIEDLHALSRNIVKGEKTKEEKIEVLKNVKEKLELLSNIDKDGRISEGDWNRVGVLFTIFNENSSDKQIDFAISFVKHNLSNWPVLNRFGEEEETQDFEF